MSPKSMNYNLLKENMNDVFVETGTLSGDSVALAIKCGFKEIYSIELDEQYYNNARDMFNQYDFVHIINGSSDKVLYDVIKNINESITFWLDAHYSGGDTAIGDKYYPIVEELEQIKKHHIKNHIILIDDVHMFDNKTLQNNLNFFTLHHIAKILNKRNEKIPNIKRIKKIIYSINEKYKISYTRGWYENSILIAKEKK